MKRDNRLKLNALSKKVLGASCKWQKLMRQGDFVTELRKNKAGNDVKVKVRMTMTLREVVKFMKDLLKEQEVEKEKANVGTEQPATGSEPVNT